MQVTSRDAYAHLTVSFHAIPVLESMVRAHRRVMANLNTEASIAESLHL